MPRKQDNSDPLADLARNEKGQFRSYAKQLEMLKDRYGKIHAAAVKAVKNNKALQAAMKQQKKITAEVTKAMRTQNSAYKQQARFANEAVKAYKASERTMRQALKTQERLFRQERKLMRQRERMARMSRRGGSGGGFGGMGLGVLGIGALGYGALRKIQNIAEKQIQAAVVAGVPAVTSLRRNLPAGVTPSRALGLLGSLQQSATLRFATQGVPLATGKLAESVKGLGDVGTELVGQFVQSLEPAMQRGFVQAVNRQGVQTAVRQYATQQNIGVATSLLNAGQLAGGQTGEPLVDAAVRTQQAFDSLNESVEKVIQSLASELAPAIEKLAAMIEGMSPGQLGLAAGGAVALGLGGKGLLKLGGRLGAGAVGLAGKGIAAAGAGTLAGAAAVGTAIGVPAALAIDTLAHGGTSIFEELAKVDVAKQQALSGSNRLAALAQRTGGLRGQKLAAQARLGQFETEHERGIFKQTIGFNRFSDADKKTIESMRNEIAKLNREIQTTAQTTKQAAKTEQELAAERKENDRIAKLQAMAAARENLAPRIQLAGAATGLAGQMLQASFLAPFRDMAIPLNPEQEAYQRQLLEQIGLLEKDLKQIDVNTDGGRSEAAKVKSEIQSLRNEQASQTQAAFTLQMQDYSDKLNVLRMQYNIAKIVPSGVVGGLKESQELQKGLKQEMSRIKGLITEQRELDTPESLREARRLQQIMLGLEAELRTLRLTEMQYLIDGFISQAMQAGEFEKIIIDQNKNLGIALDEGLIESRPYITGRAGLDALKHYARPVPTQEYIRQQKQATGIGLSAGGIVAPVHAAVSNANGLVEVARARLEVLKAERKLGEKEITLLSELVGLDDSEVTYSTAPAARGGQVLNT